jgi:site-specific DNA recombinase
MIAAVYNRVSTEKQQQEGLSLETQCEACIKYAKQHGYDVPEEYILNEVYSGLTLNRPNLNRLLTWVKNHEVQAVIIYSSDRFARDGYDLLTLIRDCDINNARLLCVSEDLADGKIGELLNFVRGWASGLEAAKIKERTMRSKHEMAKRGEIPTGFGAYGGYYGLAYNREARCLEHVPGQIDVAKEILERYAKGESATSITKDLQARNINGKAGRLFHIAGVSRVLANARVYAGVISWNKVNIPGKV